jgi:hypothetical protein
MYSGFEIEHRLATGSVASTLRGHKQNAISTDEY